MPPAPTKLAIPLSTEPEITGKRKRKASSRITDDNFVGAESNAVTKRLKLSAEELVARLSKEPEITAQRKASSSVGTDSHAATMTKNGLASSSVNADSNTFTGRHHGFKLSSAAVQALKC
jgi:hypothetical protein